MKTVKKTIIFPNSLKTYNKGYELSADISFLNHVRKFYTIFLYTSILLSYVFSLILLTEYTGY
jgi:hypothetical protein